MNQLVPVESFYCRIATCFLAWIVSSDHFSQVDVPLEASSTIIPLSPWPSTWYSDDDVPSKLERPLQKRIFDMASENCSSCSVCTSLTLSFSFSLHWKKSISEKKKEWKCTTKSILLLCCSFPLHKFSFFFSLMLIMEIYFQ